MRISYSILVHNEDKTLEKLLKFLVKWKHMDDEIVILDDYSDNEKTKIFPGEIVGMGKDHSIFSVVKGKVVFKKSKSDRTYVSVKPN